jgi:alanine dehydrogenase
MRLRVLSGQDVRRAVDMSTAIGAVRAAYEQLVAGQVEMPLRTAVPVARHDGVTLLMPAHLLQSNALGAKIVSVFPHNPDRGLPIIHALMVVLDPDTGQPDAILDGTYLTALRTGAASGVATRLLARQDARVAAIFGAGVQGHTQLEAVCTVRSIEQAWVYDRHPETAAVFVAEMRTWGPPVPSDIRIAATPADAARRADVICCATTSATPVFGDADLKPGVHINGIGSYTPEMQEVPGETVARARVLVDSRTAVLAEAGDLLIPIAQGLIDESHIHGEIGELAAGRISGRETDEEITFFKSVGVAVQDVAVAELIVRRAAALGLGQEVEL